jgi:hypothetical protein
MRTIYRIENPNDNNGMWYSGEAKPRKRIHILCPDGIAKDFPMPINPLHRKDDKIWQSAGKSIENMNQWFTSSDALNLLKHGFKLYEFKVEVFQELEMEILFCRDDIIEQREIPLSDVWNIKTK